MERSNPVAVPTHRPLGGLSRRRGTKLDLLLTPPELAQIDRASSESAADQKWLNLRSGLYTSIWWCVRFSEYYVGDGALATKEFGEWNLKNRIEDMVEFASRCPFVQRDWMADEITRGI